MLSEFFTQRQLCILEVHDRSPCHSFRCCSIFCRHVLGIWEYHYSIFMFRRSPDHMGAFARLRASLGRRRHDDDSCKLEFTNDDSTRTLTNGKKIFLPESSSSSMDVEREQASTSAPLLNPSSSEDHVGECNALTQASIACPFELSAQSTSDDKEDLVSEIPSACGSCAICWREFGTEVPLISTVVVKDSAIYAQEPHMFCGAFFFGPQRCIFLFRSSQHLRPYRNIFSSVFLLGWPSSQLHSVRAHTISSPRTSTCTEFTIILLDLCILCRI